MKTLIVTGLYIGYRVYRFIYNSTSLQNRSVFEDTWIECLSMGYNIPKLPQSLKTCINPRAHYSFHNSARL